MEISELEMVARLAASAALGALIGLEREMRDQPAGLRTHALVAVGATLFTIAGAYGFQEFDDTSGVDPARVAAQVATGIGFIGAGAILKIGVSVRGLTTAGTLWLAAALGVTIGAGLFVAAFVGAAAVFVIVVGLRVVKNAMKSPAVLAIEYQHGHGTLGEVMLKLERCGAKVGRVHLTDDPEALGGDGYRRLAVRVTTQTEAELRSLMDGFRQRPEVRSVEIESDD